MSNQAIEDSFSSEKSLRDEKLEQALPEGNKMLESSKDRGNWSYWADLMAKMKTVNPDMDVVVDEKTEKAIEKNLDAKMTEAEKSGDWAFYAAFAANMKRINPDADIVKKEAEKGILQQLGSLEKKALEKNKWQDYVSLLAKLKIIDKDVAPKPDEATEKAIVADILRSGSATDLDYAANARLVFNELTSDDLGVDASVLNEAENNLENFRDFYKNYDNYFKLKANMRILTVEKVEIK